ncbi:SufD family Fe-S cluster assembly protein [Candidatus Berkelbacteria bacterium]|nr:SufD family Fe-S cluster assembly protein [Candidatus Berkelbacteria bacterium]
MFDLNCSGVRLDITSKQKITNSNLSVKLEVNHYQPDTHSKIIVKNVLKASRLELIGKISLPPGVVGSTTDFRCDSLLTDLGSAVKTVPAMNIGENKVKASHGVAVAQFNQEHVFYLMSRGLSKKQAENLLVRSFLR